MPYTNNTTVSVRCVVCNQAERMAPADVPTWLKQHACIHNVEQLLTERNARLTITEWENLG